MSDERNRNPGLYSRKYGLHFRTASGSINSPPVLYIPTVRNMEFMELSMPLIRPRMVLQNDYK